MSYRNIEKIKKFLYKNDSNFILLIGILSYLYLYNLILNNKFYIVFVYFGLLFIGYLLCNERIIYINFIIILYDYIYRYRIEGNSYNDRLASMGKSKGSQNLLNNDKSKKPDNRDMDINTVNNNIEEQNNDLDNDNEERVESAKNNV